jgi:1,4-dihydroxy-2-naphthoyl-CoA synthase
VLSGREAVETGIASRMVADADLDGTAMALAGAIATKAPRAVRLTRQLLRGDRAELAERMLLEGGLFAEQLQSAEFMEAATAFMQKRPANFG